MLIWPWYFWVARANQSKTPQSKVIPAYPLNYCSRLRWHIRSVRHTVVYAVTLRLVKKSATESSRVVRPLDVRRDGIMIG